MSSPGIPKKPVFALPSKVQVLRVLTLTQNTSAMVFTVFLVPHLASPLVASVAGLEGADQTMMIARDLYLPLEPFLVYLPLTVHLTSSLARRTILASSSSLPRSIRLPNQIHQLLAYPLLFLLIPHILTHRLIPSSSDPAIRLLSPSEFGWEFVGYNLREWTSWAAYLGLAGAGVWHALVGGMKVAAWLRATLKRKTPSPSVQTQGKAVSSASEVKRVIPRRRRLGLRGGIMVLLGIVSVGLARVAHDASPVSSIMRKRYDAVFEATPWIRLYHHLL